MSTLTQCTYKLPDSEFKTPQTSPILKSAKIRPHGNKALYSIFICLFLTAKYHHAHIHRLP